MNKTRVSLCLKVSTYQMLKQLADEAGFKDIRVYATRKLIIPYARRMDPSREFAKNPIPNKLSVDSFKEKTIQEHLCLDEDEKRNLDKLVHYNHFIDEKGALKTSLFIACLIHYQHEKKFGDTEKKAKAKTISDDIDLDLLDPEKMNRDRNEENWIGD